jgi:hypothetical protein
MPIWYRIDPVWAGQTAVILGGGSSLTASAVRQVALARLENRCRVIAVNDSVYLAWWADWLHAADLSWWQSHVQTIPRFDGVKTTIDELVSPQWVTGTLKVTGVEGFDPDLACIRTGNNSGYQALHCAIHAGASRIVLVGFDMQGNHWSGISPSSDYVDTMAPHFASLLPTIEARKIEVFNVSTISALGVFPYCPLNEALGAAGLPAH